VRARPELRLVGRPDTTVVAFGAAPGGPDLFAVADGLERRGWHVDRQHKPTSLHLTVNAANLPVVDRWLSDLGEAVAEAVANPDAAFSGQAATYGTMARLPARGLVKRAVVDAIARTYDPAQADASPTDPPKAEGMLGRAMEVLPRALAALERARGRA
jgi:hypothetical protein